MGPLAPLGGLEARDRGALEALETPGLPAARPLVCLGARQFRLLRLVRLGLLRGISGRSTRASSAEVVPRRAQYDVDSRLLLAMSTSHPNLQTSPLINRRFLRANSASASSISRG